MLRQTSTQIKFALQFVESVKNYTDLVVTLEDWRKTPRFLEYIGESLNRNEPITVRNDLI